ncbi:MAG: hypothetical protein H6822_18710 [Planctomycetaceae bacterium]|nr:hypothetical protein [Planctomycetales bacterium]MCB9924220.1 hypothetical protein [Planctomycetaceae bacterium]
MAESEWVAPCSDCIGNDVSTFLFQICLAHTSKRCPISTTWSGGMLKYALASCEFRIIHANSRLCQTENRDWRESCTEKAFAQSVERTGADISIDPPRAVKVTSESGLGCGADLSSVGAGRFRDSFDKVTPVRQPYIQ